MGEAVVTTFSPLVVTTGRADASAAGWEILHRIRAHPDLPSLPVPHPLTGELGPHWDPLDIDHGDLGVALTFAAADELRPDDGWDRAALPYIGRAAETLAARAPSAGPTALGLFGGAGAVLHALYSLSRRGERYRTAREQVETILLDLMEHHLDTVPDIGPGTDQYDIVAGLAGPTRLLLQLPAREPRAVRTVEQALGRLVRWAGQPDGYRTPASRVTVIEREHQPDLRGGYVNLGYAHGICGVLAVLVLAMRQGIGGPEVVNAARHVAELIAGAVRAGEYGPKLPFMRPTMPVGAGGPGAASRTGWCYGNVGAALALGGYATGEPRWATFASALLASAAAGPVQPGDDNPSLCHGVGGLLVIRRHLAEIGAPTGPDTWSPAMLADRLLGMRDRGSEFGLRNEQNVPLDSPGFLTGSGGAAVALVSWGADGGLTAAESIITGGLLC